LETIADLEGSITSSSPLPKLIVRQAAQRRERLRMATGGGLVSPLSPGPGPGGSLDLGAGASLGDPVIGPVPVYREQGPDPEAVGEAGGEHILGRPETALPDLPRGGARGRACRVLFAGRGCATYTFIHKHIYIYNIIHIYIHICIGYIDTHTKNNC